MSRTIALLLLVLSALTGCLGREPDAPPTLAEVPQRLSATGLYSDLRAGTLAPGVMPFTPRFRLYSDGAEKSRWILLPPCTPIDTSDMDHWVFPVGTRLWKEFRVGGRRVETRMIERVGPGPDDFRYAAYQWDERGEEAWYVPGGVTDANGSGHDIPAASQCTECHGRTPERVLGFGAIQLSHDGEGATMAWLSANGRLTVPHAEGYALPGDAVAQAALGELHANCAHCHNPAGVQMPTPFSMRLMVGDARLADTGVYRTAVGVPTDWFHAGGVTRRVAPGDVAASAVAHRMGQRGNAEQMPPLGTHVVDRDGLAAVTAWIASSR